ncbi:MAG: hypothetical protein IJA61_01605 [Clostridia bacterium]|nr:hypothetical protein [Clostridia bacterium]
MAKLKITIEPLFIVALFLFIFFGWIEEVLFYIIALVLHEYSHYFVAKKLGYSLNNITFSPFGASLNGCKNYFKPKEEIIIAMAGPICNLTLVVVLIALWWVYPESYLITYFFVQANLALFIFNMLPLFPLDAGRILMVFIKKKKYSKLMMNIYKYNSLVIAIIFICLFVSTAFNKINFSFLFVAILLIISIFDMKKDIYYQYSFLDKTESDYLKVLENKTYIVPHSINTIQLLKFINKNTYSTFKIIDKSGKIISEVSEKELINKLVEGQNIGRN